MQSVLDRADYLALALDLRAYVTVSTVGKKADQPCFQRAVTIGEWVGLPSADDAISNCGHIAHGKFGEVLLANAGRDMPGQLILTPRGAKYSFGYQGAAALNGLAMAVSGWKQEHDKLFALMLLWSYRDDSFQLHHGGKCFAMRAELHAANSAQGEGLYRPVTGDGAHERMYFPLDDRRGGYLEHQLFPDGRPASMHWDICCDRPAEFLRFVAGAFGKEPELWDDPGKGPIGMFSITSGEITMAVMARKEWWVVEEG